MKKSDLKKLEDLSRKIQEQKTMLHNPSDKTALSELRMEISSSIREAYSIIDTENNLNLKELMRLRFIHMLNWKQISTKMYFLTDDAESTYMNYKKSLE